MDTSTIQLDAPADVWSAHYATTAGFRWWPCEELVRAIAGRRFGRVMESGCGNGANLWLLAEHADHVMGVDGNQQALDAAATYMARRGVQDRVTLRCADIQTGLSGQEPVDALVDVMTSQHVRWGEHRALYQTYRQAVRPGGWIFLYHLCSGTSAQGGTMLDGFTRDRLDLFPDAGQICLPPAWSLREELSLAGFAMDPVRTLTKHYPTGQVATYAVLTGEATCE